MQQSHYALRILRRRLGGLALPALMFLAGCRHDWRQAEAFASRIRCGMTESAVLHLAREHGVAEPERTTYRQSGSVLTIKPHQLDFVDVTFQSGEAVAVQRGNYVAFTTGMEFGEIRMICGASPIRERTLREYGRGAG